MAHVARAPGKFGRRLCVLSPCRLQPACSTGVERVDRYRVGVGWGRPRCTSTLLSLPLLLYLSVYLFLTTFSCPSEQQFLSLKMARAQGVACAGSTGRASWGGRGPSMGPRPLLPPYYRLPIFGSDQAAPSQTKAILSQIHKPTSATLQD